MDDRTGFMDEWILPGIRRRDLANDDLGCFFEKENRSGWYGDVCPNQIPKFELLIPDDRQIVLLAGTGTEIEFRVPDGVSCCWLHSYSVAVRQEDKTLHSSRVIVSFDDGPEMEIDHEVRVS